MNYVKELSKEGYICAWLILLYTSSFSTNRLKREYGGTKSDFEDWLVLNTPNRNFRKWFESMISDGLMIPIGNRLINGVEHEVFLVSKKKIKEYLKTSKLYHLFVSFYIKHHLEFDFKSIDEIRKLIKGGDV